MHARRQRGPQSNAQWQRSPRRASCAAVAFPPGAESGGGWVTEMPERRSQDVAPPPSRLIAELLVLPAGEGSRV